MNPENLESALALAREYGFGGLDFDLRSVASLGVAPARALFDRYGVAPSVFGLPGEWRRDEETWRAGLDELRHLAPIAQALGCQRTATWVMPASDERHREENIAFHIARFTPIAQILADHGIALGLEFIGPKTLRDRFAFPFIHTMSDMLALGREIGSNVGLLLDAFHWYTSHGTVADLRGLSPTDVVYVHVNDAVAGIDIDAQEDHLRRLPGESGVIDLAGFFAALVEIGYDGPVAAEPFGDGLKAYATETDRLAATRRAFDHVWPGA